MDEAAILASITRLAQTLPPDELSETTISLTHDDLYDAAVEQFGGWDVALATALKASLSAGSSTARPKQASPARSAAPLVRAPHPKAMRPLVTFTDRGFLLSTPAHWLTASPQLGAPGTPVQWPGNVGRPMGFRDLGDASGLAAVSDDGRVFGWDSRLLPDAEVGESARRLGEAYAVEQWKGVLDRDTLIQTALTVTVSARGKVKASDAELLPRPVNFDGTVVCLIDEGDELIALLPLGLRDALLLVASNGYAIHFPVEEVRPMGLRAAGVIGMKLRPGARVIAALVVGEHDEVAVISAQGFAKRVPLDDFRPQSRAGLGLVAGKLARQDRLVAAAGLTGVVDLLVTTSHGRSLRLPVEAFVEAGRPARGDRVIELDDDEQVQNLATLLPMAF